MNRLYGNSHTDRVNSFEGRVAALRTAGGAVIRLFPSQSFSPAEQLACDEALLDVCDEQPQGGFLRFWEAPEYFVVLGYSKRLKPEVVESRCEELRIPVLRRASGGGTVLQGPGCLNYSLVLPISADPELESITSTNCSIMRRVREALETAAGRELRIQGHTDLTFGGRKFSGNAQRRKRRALLFHGCFLIEFDLKMIAETLRQPAEQPGYREQRAHLDFLTNIPVNRSTVEQAIRGAWGVRDETASDRLDAVLEKTRRLAAEKYSRAEWNERF